MSSRGVLTANKLFRGMKLYKLRPDALDILIGCVCPLHPARQARHNKISINSASFRFTLPVILPRSFLPKHWSHHTSIIIMSDSTPQTPSFLCLVPVWQRPELLLTENPVQRVRSWSQASISTVSSTTSSASRDYGENGFLVLTATTSFDDVEEEE